MATLDEVRTLIDQTLELEGRALVFDRTTPLLGEVPEFDSMAVVSLVTALQDHFGIVIDDDDISADTLETLGTLVDLVERKRD